MFEPAGLSAIHHRIAELQGLFPASNAGAAPLSEEASAVASRAARPLSFQEAMHQAAQTQGLDPQLVEAVVAIESNGNPHAVSKAGAQGLMQLMPSTARALGVQNPFDAVQNLAGGAKYLRQMLDQFGSLPEALAAYNAGPGAVRRHGGIPPYAETRSYVKKVLDHYHQNDAQEVAR